jgi:hypothetical protein
MPGANTLANYAHSKIKTVKSFKTFCPGCAPPPHKHLIRLKVFAKEQLQKDVNGGKKSFIKSRQVLLLMR